jgi:hypothetical protein
MQLIVGNGVVGAGQVQVQVDVAKAAYATAKYEAGKAAVAYQVTFDAIATVTNAGASGGYSPAKITLTNAVASGTYL